MVDWSLTIDACDPARLVRFWGPVLGYVATPPPQGHATWKDYYLSVGVPEEEFIGVDDVTDRIHDPTGAGPKIWFQIVPEAKAGKNRLHLDVYEPYDGPAGPERDALVERKVAQLLEAGATVLYRSDSGFVTMGDPEGNEFCVAARPPSHARGSHE